MREYEDALGLSAYTYAPDIGAIMQSGNLYVYVTHNPIRYVDPWGLQRSYTDAQIANLSAHYQDRYISPEAVAARTDSQIGLVENIPLTHYLYAATGTNLHGNQLSGQQRLDSLATGLGIAGEALMSAHMMGGVKISGSVVKPSLNLLSEKEAERIVKNLGYKGAHEFKWDIVGRTQSSNYNIKVDTKTGEIFLEGIKNRIQIATGFFR